MPILVRIAGAMGRAFRWQSYGVPDFGTPAAVGQALPKPSR